MTKYKYIFFVSALLFIIFLASRNKLETKPPIDLEEEITETKVNLPARIEHTITKYDSLLGAELIKSETVGAAVAVIYEDKIAFLKCFGVKKVGENDSINENTIFRLASVSKPITGILAGIMASEGIIGLDDKVIDYLPDFKLKDSINTTDLTIRNILSHTSGLVPHAYDNLVEAKIPFNIIIDSMYRVDISAEPGKLYGYQNVMFSLYDTISAIKTSKKIDLTLKEKLFDPFNMMNASSGFQPFKLNNNKAYPHTKARDGYVALSLNDRYYTTIPAAGINASISDMAQLMLHMLSEDSAHSSIIDTVLMPQVNSSLKRSYYRQWGRVENKRYAIGWRIVDYKGRTIAYHGGYVRGYRAEMALCREEKIGIVYLSNSPNSTASISIPLFLNLFFDSEAGLQGI